MIYGFTHFNKPSTASAIIVVPFSMLIGRKAANRLNKHQHRTPLESACQRGSSIVQYTWRSAMHFP